MNRFAKLSLCLVSLGLNLAAQAVVVDIDAAHSSVGFSVKHMLVSKVKGQFNTFSGSFEIDGLSTEKISRKIEGKEQELSVRKFSKIGKAMVNIDVGSVDTKIAKRDEHLKGADFFDVENKEHAEYKSMTFKSEDLVEVKDGKALIKGVLTMKGVSKPVNLLLEFGSTQITTDPWGNDKVGFSAKTEKDLLRSEYGLLWNGLTKLGEAVVSDEVAVNLEIEGNLQKQAAVEATAAPAVSAETKAADAVVSDKKDEAKPKAKKAKKAKKAE